MSAKVSRGRYIAGIVLALLLAALIGYFWGIRGIRFFLVPSNSMVPTLQQHDYIFTLEQSEYHLGDIVVVHDPMAPDEYLVKRIVGLPGDMLTVNGGALFINGGYASEPYLNEPMDFLIEPTTVQPGEVWIMGDNRNESEDSADWRRGVPMDEVIGRVRWIYNPISRMQPVPSYPLAGLPDP